MTSKGVVVRYLCVLVLAAHASANVLVSELSFQSGDFQVSSRDDYAVVSGLGMDVTDEPGSPQLPVMPWTIAVPGRCRVSAVSVRTGAWRVLAEPVLPLPCPKQDILVRQEGSLMPVVPNARVYESEAAYPEQPWVWTGTGYQDGRTLVQLLVYPLRYVGAGARLEMCSGFDVEVTYEAAGGPEPKATGEESAGFEYLIVTSAALDSVFQRLAQWKTETGVKAAVRSINWITGLYPGRDNAEKLRSYTKTLPDSGVRYVLLGGDVSVVPFRKAFAMVSEGRIEPREDSLPCDLYFADLDGTWDANGNSVFGEVGDSVDLYPDLYVGRAPAASVAQAQAFVNKVLQYEKTPELGYENKALFFAEVMWTNPYTDGGRHKDRLDAACFGPGYSVTKLYERLGNESRTSVMAAIRQGQNFLNHDGHGWIDVMSCGDGSLRTRDADTITNRDQGVIYSIGCWTTAFDEASIGEAFVTNGRGGAVAFIGNSSYGWGSPGNPGFGYSDKFDDRFWEAVMRGGSNLAGEALAISKEYYIPFSHSRNVYRWHQYQVNLMGDPEMAIWTGVPQTVNVTGPAAIGSGESRVFVSVDIGGVPVKGAMVCLLKGEESYSRALTGEQGGVWLSATPQSVGDFKLTVTARNCLPVQSLVPCATGALVNYEGFRIGDQSGNGDGIANPGETVALSVLLRNSGSQGSGAVSLRLRTSDPEVTVLDSTEEHSGLGPGDSIELGAAFTVALGAAVADGAVKRFELLVAADSGSRTFSPALLVGSPVLELERYFLETPPAMPGETEEVRVAVENEGHGFGHNTRARLFSLDPYLTVLQPETIELGTLDPLTLEVSDERFGVSVSGSCPGSYLARLGLELMPDGCRFVDTFEMLVGNYGFSDDMEAGESKWTHSGTGDRWHLSDYRAHSARHAWYCGDEANHRYAQAMNAYLLTVPFMVAEHCSLSFWRWFSVPNYGVDGIYVVVLHGTSAETLDFIGTGGALGAPGFGIESEWCEERYDLSWIGVGETIQVKLGFKSDSDGEVGEGFYIDDFKVTGGGPPVTFIVTEEPREYGTLKVRACPNPFTGRLRLDIRGFPAEEVRGRVYDATGRLVTRFSLPFLRARAEWQWDGRDELGVRTGAGAYFIEVSCGPETRLAKVLRTK